MNKETIAIENKKCICIPGDPITPEELDRQLTADRISHYRFAMETLRINPDITEDEKKVRMSSISFRLDALLNQDRQRDT